MVRLKFSRRGFTLGELIVGLTVLGLLVALAVPGFREPLQRLRARAALNQVVAEIYRARMLAVDRGGPTQLILHARGGGCVERIRIVLEPGVEARSALVGVHLPGLCLRHSGDSILTFNSRGLLRPPARSLHVSYGSAADSVLLSIAGRVRRSFRRRRG